MHYMWSHGRGIKDKVSREAQTLAEMLCLQKFVRFPVYHFSLKNTFSFYQLFYFLTTEKYKVVIQQLN